MNISDGRDLQETFPLLVETAQRKLERVSALRDVLVCSSLCLCMACGRARNDGITGAGGGGMNANAGASGEPPDALHPGAHWLAVINENVELVRFDDDSPPTVAALAKNELGAMAAFSGDGKQLAYALKQGEASWDVHVVSAPDGLPSAGPWQVSELDPTLIWVGSGTLLAWAGGNEASVVLLLAQESAVAVGGVTKLEASANGGALVAVGAQRLLYLDGVSPPAWSDVIPGNWRAQLSGDGRALALFGDSAIPAGDFPLPTTRIQWAPPAPPPCTPTAQAPCPTPPTYELGTVEWASPDVPIVAEFRAVSASEGSKMALTSIDTGGAQTVTAPNAAFPVLYRNWNIDHDGRTFVLENSTGPLDPWFVSTQAARDQPAARFRGEPGFARYAALSSDQQALFVVSIAKPTTALYALAYPPVDSLASTTLFSSSEQLGALLPQPGGPGLVIGTGDISFAEPCPSTLSSACDSVAYWLSDGRTLARALPEGFENPHWVPEGAGIVGTLPDGRIVYLSAEAPEQSTTLGRGTFVLPSRW